MKSKQLKSPIFIPVIAIAYYDSFTGKYKALTCACTREEYKRYMKRGDINEYTVSCTFLREYLSASGFTPEKLDELFQKASIKTREKVFYWLNTSIITIPNLKVVLKHFGFEYNKFINAYADHLKTL